MKLFKHACDLQKCLSNIRSGDTKVGFVPTMGALHSGHISLLEMARKHDNLTVCSIFVNPTQFNDQKDFDNYPITISNDILLLEQAGCDVLFLPQTSEIYPNGTSHLPHYDIGELEHVLEGTFRPGHYQGVCQVVHKLLGIVLPDFLFLGQKDYQQCMVIQRLIEIIKSPAQIVIGSTHREPSGLAMSSRNQRLTEAEKEQATAIFKMLKYIRQNIHFLTVDQLILHASDYLLSNGFSKVNYVTIADSGTLQPATSDTLHNVVALIAASIGKVRLIDNMVMND